MKVPITVSAHRGWRDLTARGEVRVTMARPGRQASVVRPPTPEWPLRRSPRRGRRPGRRASNRPATIPRAVTGAGTPLREPATVSPISFRGHGPDTGGPAVWPYSLSSTGWSRREPARPSGQFVLHRGLTVRPVYPPHAPSRPTPRRHGVPGQRIRLDATGEDVRRSARSAAHPAPPPGPTGVVADRPRPDSPHPRLRGRRR